MLRKIIYLILIPITIFGQNFNSDIQISAELGGLCNTQDRAPFWLKSNQFGAISDSSKVGFARLGFQKKIDTEKSWDWAVGADMWVYIGNKNEFIIPELYLEGKYNQIHLIAGRKKQIHGIVDSTLSSGSFSWSGNAMPIPQIQIAVPNYQKIFNGWVGVKGHFSHGWFGEQNWVKKSFLHQKSIYVQVGNGKLKWNGGLLHNVQWGGIPKYDDANHLYINGRFANGWKVFKDVVLPFHNPPADSSNIAPFDFENRYGNHVGQLDFSFQLKLRTSQWRFYKNLPYETGQTFSNLGNLDDGLYGISFTNRRKQKITTNPVWLKKVVLEFLHTRNQGTYRSGLLRLVNFKGRQYDGNQNFYFSHAQYIDGWAYKGKTIGTPFFVPKTEVRPEYAEGWRDPYSYNNKIRAYYIAFLTQFGFVHMESRLSWTENFGSDINTFTKKLNQFSLVHKTSIPLGSPNNTINVHLGLDHGELLTDTFGGLLSYRMSFK